MSERVTNAHDDSSVNTHTPTRSLYVRFNSSSSVSVQTVSSMVGAVGRGLAQRPKDVRQNNGQTELWLRFVRVCDAADAFKSFQGFTLSGSQLSLRYSAVVRTVWVSGPRVDARKHKHALLDALGKFGALPVIDDRSGSSLLVHYENKAEAVAAVTKLADARLSGVGDVWIDFARYDAGERQQAGVPSPSLSSLFFQLTLATYSQQRVRNTGNSEIADTASRP